MASCGKLGAAAETLTYSKFAEVCGEEVLALAPDATKALKDHCEGADGTDHSSWKTVWSFFTGAKLASDATLTEDRLNPITFAMRAYKELVQCTFLETWKAELVELAPTSSSYTQDSNLFLYDCACNVVACLERAAFEAECTRSYLNPANFEVFGDIFFKKAQERARDKPLVLGLQNWPDADTAKGAAFAMAAKKQGLLLAVSDCNVALAYSRSLGLATQTSSANHLSVMQKCIDASSKKLDASQANDFLNFTVPRTATFTFGRLRNSPTFVVVHSAPPSSDEAAQVLASYVVAAGKDADADAPVVSIVDAALATSDLAAAFNSAVVAQKLAVGPSPSTITMAKKRSVLHAQFHDHDTCLQLVQSPADKIVAPQGTMGSVQTFPDISADSYLPSPYWASDHSLTTAVVEMEVELVGRRSSMDAVEVVMN